MKKILVFPFVLLSTICALGLMTCVVSAQPVVTIETVTVGDAGNVADNTGYGAVNYEFNIGKYEVTIGQYTAFLNAVASSDPYGLYNAAMSTQLTSAGISRIGSFGSYTYSVVGPSGLTPAGASSPESRPITYVNWFNAARFANWVQNGAVVGADTEDGAYTLNGATNGAAVARNASASWWIPNENEWYKSAYYKSGGTNAGYWRYPTESDAAPGNAIGNSSNQANTGGPSGSFWCVTQTTDFDLNQNYLTDAGAFSGSASAYGTLDQGGNVVEATEGLAGEATLVGRGGSWSLPDFAAASDRRAVGNTTYINGDAGFRIATIPEPSTYALLLLGGAASLRALKRRKS